MSRLLLTAPPFPGHFYSLIAFGQRLRASGHEVRFATTPGGVAVLQRLDFPVDVLLAHDPTVLERIGDTEVPVRNNPVRLLGQLRQNFAVMPQATAELEQVVARFAPDAVIADFIAPVAGWVAQRAGVGWITTIATPFAIENRRGTPSYCGGWSEPTRPWHRVRDAVGRANVHGFKTGIDMAFRRQLNALGTRVYREDGTEAVYSPQAILGLGVAELEFDRDWPASFRFAGPVTESPEKSPVPEFLRHDRRRVLVTLGTHLPWAKRSLVEQVRALADRCPDMEFVVTMGRPGRPDHEQVSPRLWVSSYLPYDDVLDRFTAVIHHGGAGILYSTLRAGRPALVFPQDYDQPDFAARLVARGAGLLIRDLDSAATATALRRVIEDPTESVLSGLARLQKAVLASDPYAAMADAVARVTTSG
ncbi:MAG TPA: glycosyl transferase [Propionibacteriaceae bacterium]|nr:glycosyl transferase [Micropruina sp.]HBX82952.1 glycosyl transferase [Propionibacteriaceae bacterium]HBY22246.1 glycosyl transferase [Propionibacteriaceae bacterium]